MDQIRPQPRQEDFLKSSADIVIFGGAAGGGKTWSLLYEPLRHVDVPRFGAVIFRRNTNQIMNEGGMYDASQELYRKYPGAVPKKTPAPAWTFPSGAKVSFRHLERDDSVYKWQGTEICLLEFDELTHFSEKMFFYMLSRNRSTCGVRPYVRATCNPDADSWVAGFISWWVDQDTGYAIPERSGQIRYMGRINEQIYWGDTVGEVVEHAKGADPDAELDTEDIKSVTFILSTIEDNQILLKSDPGYMANLKALTKVERERLLKGNWKIKAARGLYFPRNKVNLISELPNDIVRWVRAWDLAATEDKKNTSPEDGPAYTAGIMIGCRRNGRFVIADVINRRMDSSSVRQTVLNTAKLDKAKYGRKVRIRMNQDPGQAGKEQAENYLKLLSGFSVHIIPETGSKETRAEPLSAQWIGPEGSETGFVDVLIAPWTEEYLGQLESFPESKFKDMVDASATGFLELQSITPSSAPPKKTALNKESYFNR
ncbi:phage terminase large subunit [Clostridiales Family XIII bacterium ASD5510]|uniref:Phage terminase large subunit n=1 Tax=Hominibacterium faecale TaxID=2839743 RepID=A0A9J6QYB9_9FIRM|nr:phage terminase large subunit [Hominibacterium faecale]MCU7380502.1 phage terminase large subunit [Hominibacterium faecale]